MIRDELINREARDAPKRRKKNLQGRHRQGQHGLNAQTVLVRATWDSSAPTRLG
jgi:hypothetical protein